MEEPRPEPSHVDVAVLAAEPALSNAQGHAQCLLLVSGHTFEHAQLCRGAVDLVRQRVSTSGADTWLTVVLPAVDMDPPDAGTTVRLRREPTSARTRALLPDMTEIYYLEGYVTHAPAFSDSDKDDDVHDAERARERHRLAKRKKAYYRKLGVAFADVVRYLRLAEAAERAEAAELGPDAPGVTNAATVGTQLVEELLQTVSDAEASDIE